MRLPCQEIRREPKPKTSNKLSTKLPTSKMDTSSSAAERNGRNTGNAPALGMTGALSTAPPTALDLKLTKDLEESLKPHGCFETVEEMTHRMEVLSKLDRLVKDWVRDVSIQQNIPPSVAEQLGGKIYTFGSYRLGVHNRGADIDALCVTPKNIDRLDYFTTFYEYLKQQAEVTHLRAIAESFVPVIKMKFENIEIDMVFARVATKEVPDGMELNDDTMLKNLDQKCVRSLNGCRVTDEILRLVPNIESFRLALRAIKLWAKKSGIYSNALGYLGGVSWAMLVARTCQLYPNAAAATTVLKFFLIFTTWDWPKPVLLKPMQNSTVNSQFTVWDPRVSVADRYHLMPIITPAYPQQNSTFNVSVSTRQIMVDCLHAGFETCKRIYSGAVSWDALFDVPNFFQQYRHFIVLIASSGTKEAHLEWYGLVESRIRHLIGALERNPQIKLPRLWPQSYTPINVEDGQYCSCWFIGLEFQTTKNLNLDLTNDIAGFTDTVMRVGETLNSFKEGMDLDARYVRRKDLTQYLSPDVLKPKKGDVEEPRKRKRSTTSNSGSGDTPTKKNKSIAEEDASVISNGKVEEEADSSGIGTIHSPGVSDNGSQIVKTEAEQSIGEIKEETLPVPTVSKASTSDSVPVTEDVQKSVVEVQNRLVPDKKFAEVLQSPEYLERLKYYKLTAHKEAVDAFYEDLRLDYL